MTEISLTDFVDFVTKSGAPRLTKVRDVKSRPDEYDPATDFWKPLREGIVQFHKTGSENEKKKKKKELDRILETVADSKKAARYAECVAGYKKFLGKKKHVWLAPSKAPWIGAGLTVRVNPEVGLELDGVRHILKLHFKADKLTKIRTSCVLLLMAQALGPMVAPGTQFGVVDVPRGKLYAAEQPDDSLLPLLIGESAAFASMWDQL